MSRLAPPLPARLAPAPGTRLRDYCQVRHKLRIEVRNCRRSPLVKYLPTLNYLFEYHITVKKCLSSSSMVENCDYDEKLTWASTYIITYLLHSTQTPSPSPPRTIANACNYEQSKSNKYCSYNSSAPSLPPLYPRN